MGITSLLQNLRSITTQGVAINTYEGKRAAVDSYCWLHKCAYSCSREIVEGIPTDAYVHAFVNRARMLKSNGVDVIYVFDGASLPSKRGEESVRMNRRETAKQLARKMWNEGNRKAAFDQYAKAVDVTFEMAKRCLDAIRKHGLGEVLVAPFEADAQLAYLALNGIVDVVITEDSDLLAHGCPVVLYKMDQTGICDEVRFEDLPRNKGLRFDAFTPDLFLQMCVMSGCDYLTSLPNVGMKKAHQAMRKCREYSSALRSFKFEGIRVDQQYELGFRDALITFKHALVYCPRQKKCVNLNAIDNSTDTLSLRCTDEDEKRLLGDRRSDAISEGVANGYLHPTTLHPFPHQHGSSSLAGGTKNKLTNNNNNDNTKMMTMDKHFDTTTTNNKREESAKQQQHLQKQQQQQKNRPHIRSSFFASQNEEEERRDRSKREALEQYAKSASTLMPLVSINRATPEFSLQSPMRVKRAKTFDLFENSREPVFVSSSKGDPLRKSPRLLKTNFFDEKTIEYNDEKAIEAIDNIEKKAPGNILSKYSPEFLKSFACGGSDGRLNSSKSTVTVIPNTTSIERKNQVIAATTAKTKKTACRKRRTSKRLSGGDDLFKEFMHASTE